MIHGPKSSAKQRLTAVVVGILTCLGASYGLCEGDSLGLPQLQGMDARFESQPLPEARFEPSTPGLTEAPSPEHNPASPPVAEERYASAVRLVALQGFAVGMLVSLFLVLIALLLLVLANGRVAARQPATPAQAETEARSATKASPAVAQKPPTTPPANPPGAPLQVRSERGGVFQQILEQNIQLRRVFYADTAG